MFTYKDTPHERELTLIGWNHIRFCWKVVYLNLDSRYSEDYSRWMFEPEIWYNPWYSVMVF